RRATGPRPGTRRPCPRPPPGASGGRTARIPPRPGGPPAGRAGAWRRRAWTPRGGRPRARPPAAAPRRGGSSREAAAGRWASVASFVRLERCPHYKRLDAQRTAVRAARTPVARRPGGARGRAWVVPLQVAARVGRSARVVALAPLLDRVSEPRGECCRV